jgi:hypothetical protein
MRATAIDRTLSRISSVNGCRGQDPKIPPELLASPLQLGMAKGSDYVTGTAVGAPVVILLAAAVGFIAGPALYSVGIVRHRVWAKMRRSCGWRVSSVQRSAHTPEFTVEDCAVAAASGSATLMAAAAAIVSQSAAAAAVLRATEGAVEGTPDWYPAAAVVAAVTSTVLPMAALHAAWVWSGMKYVRSARRLHVRTAAILLPGGLKQQRAAVGGVDGVWVAAQPQTKHTNAILTAMLRAAREALYGDFAGGSGLLVAAQFATASQALQGVAQAAGEFGSAGRGSCATASLAQLAIMVGCTVVQQWARPQRVRRNHHAELLPTALQTGLCAAVMVLAARRGDVNATVAAWLGVALDVSGLIQPVLNVALALV